MKEIQSLFPQVIGKFAGSIGEGIDIEKIVTQKITALTPQDLENKLKPALRNELKGIKMLGFIAGFIIGIVQLLFMLLILKYKF